MTIGRIGNGWHPPAERSLKALLQRVGEARVEVAGECVAAIGNGVLVFLGIEDGDDAATADRMVEKILSLRIFQDSEGKMNEPVGERDALCVSQFTLCAETDRGTRPGFAAAAPPEIAEPLYERVRDGLGGKGGLFGADMQVHLVNDGPVTIPVQVAPSST